MKKACFEFESTHGCAIEKSNGLDYTNPLIAEYYLLKYAISYVLEYTIMYRSALSQLEHAKTMAAYSFGCGSKIDCISLAYASRILQINSGFPKLFMSYTGIDLISWPIQFEVGKMESIYNKIDAVQDIVSFMDSAQNMNCNIFFLSKILSEIKNDKIFIEFCDKIKHHIFNEKKIILCVSYSSNFIDSKDDLKDEMEMTQQIIYAFESNGYKCQKTNFPNSIFDFDGFILDPHKINFDEGNRYPLIVLENPEKDFLYIDSKSSLPENIRNYICTFRCYTINCIQYDDLKKKHQAQNKDFCSASRYKGDFAQCIGCEHCMFKENVQSLCFQVLTLLKK